MAVLHNLFAQKQEVLIIALLRVLHVYFFGSYCSKPRMDMASRIS